MGILIHSSNWWGKSQSYWLKQDSRSFFIRANMAETQCRKNFSAGGRQVSAGFPLKCSFSERPLCINGC